MTDLGDYELLTQLYPELHTEVEREKTKELKNIDDNKTLIINLDDLEEFWRISNKQNVAGQFIEFVENWGKCTNKGRYHFSFSYFIAGTYRHDEVNNNYIDFFNWKGFVKMLKEKG